MLHKNLIRRLDLITLKLFVAVHEEGTLTRAAAREAIAVSAASKRLAFARKTLTCKASTACRISMMSCSWSCVPIMRWPADSDPLHLRRNQHGARRAPVGCQ
jgi:hypothetical protein